MELRTRDIDRALKILEELKAFAMEHHNERITPMTIRLMAGVIKDVLSDAKELCDK